MTKVAVYRKAHFNAARRLYNKNWSNEKNNEVFGLCNNPNWHGHNYDLEVCVIGEIDKDTGYVIDLGVLRDIIKTEIEERYKKKNLNEECPEFENLIPTVENIAVVIYNILKNKLDKSFERIE